MLAGRVALIATVVVAQAQNAFTPGHGGPYPPPQIMGTYGR
jgi:hypothetical protein